MYSIFCHNFLLGGGKGYSAREKRRLQQLGAYNVFAIVFIFLLFCRGRGCWYLLGEEATEAARGGCHARGPHWLAYSYRFRYVCVMLPWMLQRFCSVFSA